MFERWLLRAIEGPVRDGTRHSRGDQRLAQHDQFKRLDQNLAVSSGETEAVHTGLVAQSHEAEVALIRQDHDPGLRSLLSRLLDDLKYATGVLAGLDQDQGSLRN